MTVYEKLASYIKLIRNDREAVWRIPITQYRDTKNTPKENPIYSSPSKIFLATELGVSIFTLRQTKYQPLIRELQEIFVEHGVIIVGVDHYSLNLRQRALNWWGSLSNEEKLDLKTSGNSIRMKQYIKGWMMRTSGSRGHEMLLDVMSGFNQELIKTGALSADYMPVKGRDSKRNKNYKSDLRDSGKRWEELSGMPLDIELDLLTPGPSIEKYIQLKQLFASKLRGVASNSGKSNYIISFMHFSTFLEKEGIPFTSTLNEILNEFILIRFYNNYILPNIEADALATNHVSTILSAARQTLKRAKQIKGLGFDFYHDVEFVNGTRETDSYKPFTKGEREQINVAIADDIESTLELLKPYVKSGVGEYPLDDNFKVVSGKNTLDNAQFLFENYLNCKLIFNHTAKSELERGFLRMASGKTGLHDSYRQWGILTVIDQHVVAPFIFRLAQITGMNVESLKVLKLDDFEPKHHATGKPCLRYWKERSGGAKELHLDLFEAKIQWLTTKQSKEVESIFKKVKMLTTKIRIRAHKDICEYLFIYESSGQQRFGEILSYDGPRRLSLTYKPFVRKHNLLDDEGNPTNFLLTRFRPSFVSEMIDNGVSIREVQLMLGHRNIETTVNYLDKLDFNKIARAKVKSALENIHSKVFTPSKEPENTRYLGNPDKIIFKTPLGGCANIFNPPKFIKESKAYVKGQACSQYNKCLSCENVMLTASHLPDLFAMRRDYLSLIQSNRIMDTPYGVVIQENMSLLDELLSEETSEFSKDELISGERLSKFVETAIIDNVGA